MSGVIARYLWDFGDGSTSSEVNPQHTYVMPGVYTVSLTVWDDDGVAYTEIKRNYIRVYDNDYSSGTTRNVTKTDTIIRLGVPQEKNQGIGWCFYEGTDYPNALGVVGCCRIYNEYDEERIIVTDSNTFKHYWLGKEDNWKDGANEEYGGSDIESDILFREHVAQIRSTAKIRHSESEANLKPWFKDRRSTGDYNEFGFRDGFKTSMYFREDSSPDDRAEVKYFPRKAQIVSDRKIESESIQAGLRITNAPWRLASIQQWFEEIDTGGSPAQKQMSEKTWAELIADSYVWVGRSIELVDPDDGTHTMPWDKGSNQRTTGSFSGVTVGPDGNSRSAVSFGASDSMAIEQDFPPDNFTIMMWVKSPTDPCTIFESGDITIRLTSGWDLDWDDGNNVWSVALSAPLTHWTMLTITKHGNTVEIYENNTLANTRHFDDTINGGTSITFFGGNIIGFEPRVIGNYVTSDVVDWVYNDVIENSGNSTCAMY